MKKITYTFLFCGNHGNERAVFTAFVEFHNTVDESIQRMVSSHTDILAGVMSGTTLTDNNVAGDALLTTKNLNA